MISKRSKTTTLRKKQSKNAFDSSKKSLKKKQKKYSNRIRSIKRTKIGGAIYSKDESISLQNFEGFERSDAYLTPDLLDDRQKILKACKEKLDKQIGSNLYSPSLFNSFVTDVIDDTIEFKWVYRFTETRRHNHGIDREIKTIFPILKEYLNAGFTVEQLLLSEKCTLNSIFNVFFPILAKLTNLNLTKNTKIQNIKKNLEKYFNFTSENLKQLDIPDDQFIWKQEDYDKIKQSIRNTIIENFKMYGLKGDLFLKIGYSRSELDAHGINYSLQEFKNAGISFVRLQKEGFSAVELKNVGFPLKDFRDNGYILRQLLDAGFTVLEIRSFLKQDRLNKTDFSEDLTLDELKGLGITPKTIYENIRYDDSKGPIINAILKYGFTLADIRWPNFTNDLDIGYFRRSKISSIDLINVGFTPKELQELLLKEPSIEMMDPNAIPFYMFFISDKQGNNIITKIKKTKKQNQNLAQELTDKGYTLQNIITTTNEPKIISTNLLKELKDLGYDLIGNDAYNLSHIFETGKYTYGDVKAVFDLYAADKLNKPQLTKIEDRLRTLKKNCKRNMLKVTDLGCTYTP
jgi:hypothetical protein